jgi:hypothetical protein
LDTPVVSFFRVSTSKSVNKFFWKKLQLYAARRSQVPRGKTKVQHGVGGGHKQATPYGVWWDEYRKEATQKVGRFDENR